MWTSRLPWFNSIEARGAPRSKVAFGGSWHSADMAPPRCPLLGVKPTGRFMSTRPNIRTRDSKGGPYDASTLSPMIRFGAFHDGPVRHDCDRYGRPAAPWDRTRSRIKFDP